MRQFNYWIVGFTFAVVLATGKPVVGAPIEINSGFLTVSGAQDFFSRGFLRSIAYDFSTEDFELSWLDSDGLVQNVFSPTLAIPSLLTLAGGGDDLVAVQSQWLFSTTPSTSPTTFEVEGTLTFRELATGAFLFSTEVFGDGVATWTFVPGPSGSPVVSGVTYDFSDQVSVPEPALIVLLAAAVLGFGVKRGVVRHPARIARLSNGQPRD